MSLSHLEIDDPAFWQRPLEERMAHFATLREEGPFTRGEFENLMTNTTEEYFAVTRYDEVVEISRNAKDFSSAQGATSIPDLPPEALEFLGGFINMDSPRHERQRRIVARSFTPKHLQGVLDSVERICTELVDDMCEKGEVDLVQAISQPFPMLTICDMMGIPRSEFQTVLTASNTILGAGDPEFMGGKEIVPAILEAGVTLTMLMNELADERRRNPTDDLTTMLVHAVGDEDVLTSAEIASFFILLVVAGNDTVRTAVSAGMHLLAQNPDQRQIWQNDVDGVTPTAIEEIVRVASPVTFMRRTTTRRLTMSGQDFAQGSRLLLYYGAANRDPRVFKDPERFDVLRDPNPHIGYGGPGPHFCLGAHLARRELSVVFRELLTRLPDIETTGDPVLLEAMGVPLIGGIKRLPVKFTPTARVGVA